MRDHRRWTVDEILLFRELRAKGLKVPALALRLHRSPGSVQGRINREKVGLSPRSQQPALIRLLLLSPKSLVEIKSQGFTYSALKRLVTRGHVVGRTTPGAGPTRIYEVTREGQRNLDSRYPNPLGPPKNGPGKHPRAS